MPDPDEIQSPFAVLDVAGKNRCDDMSGSIMIPPESSGYAPAEAETMKKFANKPTKKSKKQ
jgi:hypothetical protein